MLHFAKQKYSVNTFGKSVELLPAYIQFLLKLPKLLTRSVKVDSGSEQDHYAVFPLLFPPSNMCLSVLATKIRTYFTTD